MSEPNDVNPFDPPRQPLAPEFAIPHQGPAGIGGWLILVTIGLVITLLGAVFTLATIHIPLVLHGDLALLMDPASPSYRPLWGPLVICEIGFNLALVALAGAGLFLMFNKSRSFPKLMIAFYLGKIVIFTVHAFLASRIPELSTEVLPEETRQLGFSIIAAFIWIPYMLVSKRVKNTFVD